MDFSDSTGLDEAFYQYLQLSSFMQGVIQDTKTIAKEQKIN